MHRAEAEVIPAGIEKGWPTSIEFEGVPQEVTWLLVHLRGTDACPQASLGPP